jgi:pimeloyl-ACP methyl ester carboxylesterase
MEGQIKYAKSGDVHIAYRIFGDGPRDMVLIPGTLSHVEVFWEFAAEEYLLKRLTSFARVIVFDKRGQGLSDRVVSEQTLDERIGDVRAVMDATGSKSATVYGWSEGGPMSLMFAATYPERTSALVLYGTFASVGAEPWSVTPEQWDEHVRALQEHWGTGQLVAANSPSQINNPAYVQSVARLERASASPASIAALFRANYEIDVRHILPSIHLPALIMHRKGDALVPVKCGRYLAEHIPEAKYVEIPGDDHFVSDPETQDVIADEIEEFITGEHHRPEPDRVLATVMFTDIVQSTEQAAEMGDRKWRVLLDSYYATVRKELTAFRGRDVKTLGDGILATFDGPARAIRCACSVREKVGQIGLQVRTGLHTGECELMGDDVGGIAVHIGSRVSAQAAPGEVLVSGTVKDLVAGSGLRFADQGMKSLKGVPGEWRLYAVQ